HEQHLKRDRNVKSQGFDTAEVEKEHECLCYSAIKRTHSEGRELGRERANANNLSRHVHIANSHPSPSNLTPHQVFSNQGEDNDEADGDKVAEGSRGFGTGHHEAEERPRRSRNRAGRIVVVEPCRTVEEPDEKKLRRQSGHGQIQPLDTQTRYTKDQA